MYDCAMRNELKEVPDSIVIQRGSAVRHKTSFRFVFPVPRSRGLGCFGDGFHPIWASLRGGKIPSRMKVAHQIYDLKSCWDSAVLMSVKLCAI